MSDRNRGQHPPPKQGLPKLKAVMLVPPRDVDASAPPLVNEIVVNGGVDCVMVDFYYISRGRFIELVETGEGVDRSPLNVEVGIHRMQPTARVSMPFIVAAELVTKLLEAAAEGAMDIRDLGPDFVERIGRSMATVQAIGNAAQGARPSAAPEESAR